MLKETFIVYFGKIGKSQEFQCQFLQLKMQVAQFENKIPFDCLVLIDQNNQVYSATQQQEQRKQNLIYRVFDVRDIITQERIRQQQLQQENQNPTTEILYLKAKLYDLDQQIQKKDKTISQLQGELYIQKAESDNTIQELQNQISSLIEEKQKADSTFKILIKEKIDQFQFIQDQLSDQERQYKNEIEILKNHIKQFELAIMDKRSNDMQDNQKIKEQYEKQISQLQEELSQQKLQFLRENQELLDMNMACKEQEKESVKQIMIQKFSIEVLKQELEKSKLQNYELSNKVQTLTQKPNELQKNNQSKS
ncbi:unnamed protein product [Paramecium octaurelia]|uniref:Uncharacterized protein n=1 Tax=Paramecium octaurelia TaxID=43137 RepID=A0A8S1V543_PAROT|nr:unnamed protein product [Paramecium octaurelia]